LARSVALFGFAILLSSPVLSATPLSAPSLSATAASSSQINLTWTDPNTSETGYQVERSLSSTSGFVLVTTTAANVRSFSNSGLASNTTYYYRVRALGNGNNSSSYSNVASARTLATSSVPAAPSNLTASAASSSQINLSWTDKSTNETAFKVERATASAGPWTQIGTTAGTTFASTALAASTTYYFRVRASNAYGDSAYTNTAFATTLAAGTSLPAAPSSLTATAASSTQINLAWADNSANESGFKLEVSTATTPWTQFTTVGPNVRSYASTFLSAGVTYSYRVRAYNTSGDSAYSNTASATTPGGTGGTGAHIWSTHFGGTSAGVDSAKPVGIVVDSTGASVVLGTLNGSVNFGGGSLTSAGNGDIYLVKYSSTGGYVWSKRFGGASNEVPKGIAIDSNGNIVITGFFGGTVDFGGGALTGSSASGFVAKYSSAGAHLWSRRISTGTVLDEGTAIGVDGAGNVIVAGGFYGTVNFGGGSMTSAGAEDIVLLKYNSAGTFLWSRRIGGASDEVVMSLAVDTTTGEFVTAGYFAGSVNFGGTTLTSAGGNDAFVARYNSSNGHVWSKRWGSTSEDKAFSVDVDGLGNVAVTGFFTNNVDFGGGPITNVGGVGSGDIFLVKLSPAGIYTWSKGFGSSLVANQYGYGVAFDGAGNVLLTGGIVALTSPYTIDFGGGPFTGDGYSNAFIAKFGSGGTYTWAKRYLAGGGHAAGLGIAADSGNNVLSTGYYNNSINLGGTTLLSPGATDAYLVKLGP
jgi:hypothetical protein